MQSILKTSYGLIQFALLLSGIELFAWFYLHQEGYLQTLINNDQSHVSLVIMVIYALATLHFLWACYIASQYFFEMSQKGAAFRRPLLKYFFDQLSEHATSMEEFQSHLEVLEIRLRSSYAFGFVVADLMLKLGILGTVIGFIIMLGSLSNLNSVDITVMQTLLVEMSGGMKVALFTTLTGLLAGILLNIKYNLLDWAVDHLLNDIRESVHIND